MLVQFQDQLRPGPQDPAQPLEGEGVGPAAVVGDDDRVDRAGLGQLGGAAAQVVGMAPGQFRPCPGRNPLRSQERHGQRQHTHPAQPLEQAQVGEAVQDRVGPAEDAEHLPPAAGREQVRDAPAEGGLHLPLDRHRAPVGPDHPVPVQDLQARGQARGEGLLAFERDRGRQPPRAARVLVVDEEGHGHGVLAGMGGGGVLAREVDYGRHEHPVEPLVQQRVEMPDGELDGQADAHREVLVPQGEGRLGGGRGQDGLVAQGPPEAAQNGRSPIRLEARGSPIRGSPGSPGAHSAAQRSRYRARLGTAQEAPAAPLV